MDRAHSLSGSQKPSPSAGTPFAYQQRLLERTTSRAGSLSRSSSQTANSILTTPTGTRRWTPTHRVGQSLDAVKGRFETERLRTVHTEPMPEHEVTSPESAKFDADALSAAPDAEASFRSRYADLLARTPTRRRIPDLTPPEQKRYSVPEPIIAAALSPNTTGVTIESPDSPSASELHRIRLPVSAPLEHAERRYTPYAVPLRDDDGPDPAAKFHRARALEALDPTSTGSSTASDATSSSSVTSASSRTFSDASFSSTVHRRPTSVYGNLYSSTPSPDKASLGIRPRSHTTSTSARTIAEPAEQHASSSFASSASASSSSVMSPKPYRSSYMQQRTSRLPEHLTAGRKMGRHLPRIASGEVNDEFEDEPKEDEGRPPDPSPPENPLRRAERVRRAQSETRERKRVSFTEPRTPHNQSFGVGEGEDVAGLRGRLRLSRDMTSAVAAAAATPLPQVKATTRWTRGLWADVQRHLLQAYEYLCHIGEAKQWIEGCLGEELSFDIVEMEERMRDGVVLAKLVRVFQGEAVVRRIYEAPKLDFRHSDNINVFFNFVRYVGLPESFCFELTDLYEKKNFPKVIYCIHALSHLLARRGLAQRIGDLVGQLQFSDDQLQKTHKGLKDSGVAMPNFAGVKRELAKEINEEPEEEEETEYERRERLLRENEHSIIACQSVARSFLARKALATQQGRIKLAERHVPKLQALARGFLVRSRLVHERKEHANLDDLVVAIQAHARGTLVRRDWHVHLQRVRGSAQTIILIQAQARGVIQRRRLHKLLEAMRSCQPAVVKLQAFARARLAKKTHNEVQKTFATPVLFKSIVQLQAHARGVLARRRIGYELAYIDQFQDIYVALQAQTRGVLIRRRIGAQLAKLDDATDVVVRIQAAVRTYLARKRLLTLIRGLRKATPSVVAFQAALRGFLVRRKHKAMSQAMSQVTVVKSVGSLQALARAALARKKHQEQSKQLEFIEPDVVGFQAHVRGALVRMDYCAWRDYLHQSHPAATILQAMLRGVMQRRKFQTKMRHYRENLDKVIQIQSLFRAKETREQYRQLTLGTNVTVDTIKNFVHLLDNSEADFQEELKLERLRQEVVKRIRENQALEAEVDDLDVKIALVVQNVKSFEELIKARRLHGGENAAAHAARASVLAAHGDPFAGPSALDHAAKRKLELYQQLFYLLQTKTEYLSRLFTVIAADKSLEKNRKLVERVTLTLFGYGQDRREDYLLLKLFQNAIQDEIKSAATIEDVIKGHPVFVSLVVPYIRPKQTVYVRETLQSAIHDLVKSGEEIDLETDPSIIYRNKIDLLETRTGQQSNLPKNIPFREALQDPDTRAEYIRHLQLLQWWTDLFVTNLTQSTAKMPYGMRYIARETLVALKERFPHASDEAYAACIARLVYYRYVNPAIMTPETFDIVKETINVETRKNLAQISRMLTQITSGLEFGDDSPHHIPVNDYVRNAIQQTTSWLFEVANVPDAETQYHAHEFLDATFQPKSIFISPNEVYAMHTLLSQYLEHLGPGRDDTLRVILHELDGVPNLGNDELHDARDAAIEMQLTNRFAHVKDPSADEKAIWVQSKRAVLAILRVQPAKDLVESLMQPVTDEHELAWEAILEEMEREQYKQQRRMPSTTHADDAYRLEDIRSMTFREVKAHAIFYLLELEKRGLISRGDGYQGVLNAIAGDVRSKNRRRIQRQNEKDSMEEAIKYLGQRKKNYEEQIESYHNYVEAAMQTMQRGKGKKRFVLPFTKQYFHMRDLQKTGKAPQFGSYRYSAQHFYEKGILLSIDQYSPRQFDKLDIVLSSNNVGVFTVEIFNTALGITNRMAYSDIKMEELLQAQFEDKASITLFNGLAKFNLNLLLWQINKKFYV
ncbi:ras GTPase-activating protein [Phanerochaete sordida]|uniref:Ras GTPase-activating protein n=1 Tax=Phanerochaete sordida TaxID=48140 RepID=A0A9P3FX24_9APHY|nr:ras GTPase-activating protein [Phanerochaete sordida]